MAAAPEVGSFADFVLRAFPPFVGVCLAFGLALLRELWERRRVRIERFNTALFILMLQRSYVMRLLSDQLTPKRNDEIRAYLIPPILSVAPAATVNVEALAFLISAGQGELVNQLTVAEAQYRSLVALIEARNAAHLSFQEKLEAAEQAAQQGKQPQSTQPAVSTLLEECRMVAGKALSARLEQMTDALYSHADAAITFNRDVHASARGTFKRLFWFARRLFRVEELPLSEQK